MQILGSKRGVSRRLRRLSCVTYGHEKCGSIYGRSVESSGGVGGGGGGLDLDYYLL